MPPTRCGTYRPVTSNASSGPRWLCWRGWPPRPRAALCVRWRADLPAETSSGRTRVVGVAVALLGAAFGFVTEDPARGLSLHLDEVPAYLIVGLDPAVLASTDLAGSMPRGQRSRARSRRT